MPNRLPTVTSNIPKDLRRFIDRLREYFASAGEDGLVTKGDLTNSGGFSEDANGNLVFGDGSLDDIRLDDIRLDDIRLAAPTGFTATPATLNVILEWDNPNNVYYAYTEIWRNTVDDLGTAVLIGTSGTFMYADNIGPDETRYYWIRHVNTENEPSPYNATAGTSATTPPNVAWLLDQLTGQLTESQLYSTLNSRIDLIDTPITGLVDKTGDLSAQYTVKIDNSGYVTGYGLASTVVNGVPTSEFVVVADKFAIAPVATSHTAEDGSPFFHLTAPTTINGETIPAGTYMKAAFIHDATITTAKIGDLAVDTAKIADGAIVSAKIGDAQITNAKIADVIESNNYTATTGWRLDKSGTLYANQIVISDSSGNIILQSGGKINWSGIDLTGGSVTDLDFAGDLNATKNTVYRQITAPTEGVTDGDIWVDTDASPAPITYIRASGVWEPASNYTTNTSELTDGANLGDTAIWYNVTGSGKPENYADRTGSNTAYDTARVNGTSASTVKNNAALGATFTSTDAGFFAYLDQINSGNISTYIASAAISDAYIANLNASKINAGTIAAARIGAGSITADKIAAGTITANEIAAGTITANEIQTNTITAASGIIADATIDTAQIKNAAVETLKIAGRAVTFPTAAESTVPLSLNVSSQIVLSIAVQQQEPYAEILLNGSAAYSVTSTNSLYSPYITLYVTRNGATIYGPITIGRAPKAYESVTISGIAGFTLLDTGNAYPGTITYRIYMSQQSVGNGTKEHAALSATELMR